MYLLIRPSTNFFEMPLHNFHKKQWGENKDLPQKLVIVTDKMLEGLLFESGQDSW